MSELIVVAFDDKAKAETALNALKHLQQETYVINLEDAAVVIKGKNGEVKRKQMFDLTAGGAAQGGLLGLIAGLLLGIPLPGAVAGAVVGGLVGSLIDLGLKDDFIREVGETLKPNTSALMVQVHWAETEQVLKQLHGFGGKVLQTTLPADIETRLQDILKAKNEPQT